MEGRKISKSIGMFLLIAGLFVCIFGFNTSMSAPWQSSMLYNGFAQMLLGIAFLLTTNAIINIGKNT
jgi:hypothetical protein